MKRVLQIFGRFGRGGIETFVMNLYKAINREEIQFDFLLATPDGDYEEEAKQMGARIFYTPPRNKGLRAYNKYLDDFFKHHATEYCAVHQHASSLSSIEPISKAAKYKIPVRILHAHSSSIKKSIKVHWLHYLMHLYGKSKVRNVATNYIGCSDVALDWLFKNTGVRSQAQMINNGINTSEFAYNERIRNEVRMELNLNSDYSIGLVASFIPVKNHKFLLKVFSELLKREAYAKLVLIGEGPLHDEIEKEAMTLGIANNVIFAGLRRDVNRVLQGLDMVVMPSIFEGLPVSLVEAQAAGLPIIASDNISKDVILTPNIQFMPITVEPSIWADKIIEIMGTYIRTDCSDNVDNAGFGIKSISSHMCNIYLGQS